MKYKSCETCISRTIDNYCACKKLCVDANQWMPRWRRHANSSPVGACQTCRFFEVKIPVVPHHTDLARCHRWPPTVVGYPKVAPYDWCGEHQLKPERRK